MKLLKIPIILLIIIIFLSYKNICQQPNTDIKRYKSIITAYNYDDLFPHYRTDMPIDCIKGYILMDSVSCNQDTKRILEQISNWDIDNLKIWSKYLYSVTDYDPRLLRSYLKRTIYIISQKDVIFGIYYSYPSNLYYTIENAIKNKIDEFGKEYAMLFMANCIYKVTIDSVETGIDTTYGNKKPLKWLNTRCFILEKIKGFYIPSNCWIHDGPLCLNFGYPLNWDTGMDFANDKGNKSENKIREVKTGEEYFIFLNLVSCFQRYRDDIILPLMQLDPNGGLFRIKDGFVEDDSGFWGLGSRPTVEQFRSHLDSLINDIKSW